MIGAFLLAALVATPAPSPDPLCARIDHAMYRADGSRVDYWETIEDWLRKRGVLDRSSAGTR